MSEATLDSIAYGSVNGSQPLPSRIGALVESHSASASSASSDSTQDSTQETAVTDANYFAAWEPKSVATYESTPLPEHTYIIDGLLPVHGVAVFHGMPGSFKTQLVLDAASCVAAGSEWLPQLPNSDGDGHTFATRQTAVCWLNFDMADEDIHERAAAVSRTRPLPAGAVFDVVSLPTPWLDMSKAPIAVQLSAWIKSKGYGLVVIDNFSNIKGAAKLIDETIADVMLNVRRLSKDAGCAVWLIHHETKSTLGKTPFEKMYGGVHIAAAVEAAFSVTRDGDKVALNASKQRGRMSTTAFSALHTYEGLPGGALSTFRFSATTPAAKHTLTQEERTPLQSAIENVLSATPNSFLSVADLVARLGGEHKESSVRNALGKLLDKGRVKKKDAGKGSAYAIATSGQAEQNAMYEA